jgi:hypothetical protein
MYAKSQKKLRHRRVIAARNSRSRPSRARASIVRDKYTLPDCARATSARQAAALAT